MFQNVGFEGKEIKFLVQNAREIYLQNVFEFQ